MVKVDRCLSFQERRTMESGGTEAVGMAVSAQHGDVEIHPSCCYTSIVRSFLPLGSALLY